MIIEFNCPSCGGTLHVEDDSAGQLIRCGACMTTLRVPEVSEPPLAAELDDSHGFDRAPPRRRRRRRPPPPPRGRGPLFWVIVILGVIGLGSCALCGLVALLLPGPEWRTHQSEQGGFKVELPAPARVIRSIPGVKMDPKMKTEGAFLLSRGEEYAIVYGDILPRNQRLNSDDEVLDAGVREMESDPDCRRMVRNEPVMVSGFKAREIEFVGKDGGTRMGRVIVADSRFFVVLAGGRFVRTSNANLRRFVNSFEVTDPTLQPLTPRRANGPGPH